MHKSLSDRRKQNPWPTTKVTLLERIQDLNDAGSWKQFVDLYGPLVKKYCQRRGMQDSDARDVAQEVMIIVSKCIERFRYDAERGQFRNWLGTIAHRVMLKHLARQMRLARTEGGVGGDGKLVHDIYYPVSEIWLELFAAHVFRAAIEHIRLEFDSDTFDVFQQTFVKGVPADGIASHFGRSIGWVYQAKSKVVRRLKQEILILAEDSVLVDLSGYKRSSTTE